MSTEQPGAPNDCRFCKVSAGESHADSVHETATTLEFRDIEPQAPTQVLVIPKEHQRDVVALGESAEQGVVELFQAVGAVATQEGLEAGYRSVFNTVRLAHQVVFHAHVHVLGGRSMTWPPG